MSGTRLLIWDFDGTLVHRRGETGWSILLAEALDAEEPGHGHSADTIRSHLREGFPWHQPEIAHPLQPGGVGRPARPGVRGGGLRAGAALELADAARRLYVDPTSAGSCSTTRSPRSSGSRRRAGRTRSSRNHVPELRQIVAALGLDDFIAFLSCSAETGYEKPHAQAFASVLDPLRAAEAWMIGDNVVADVLGAEAVGIPAVLVRRPDPRAARYADSLAGVEAFLSEAVAA